jgi:hypothetical protein
LKKKAASVAIDEVPAHAKPWWRRGSWADLGVRRGRPLPRGFLGVVLAYCGFVMLAMVVLIVFTTGPLPGEVPPLGGITLAMFAASTMSLMARQRPRHAFLATCVGLVTATGLALAVHHAQVPNLYGRAALYVVGIAIAYSVSCGVTWIPRLGGRPDPAIEEPARWVEFEVILDTPDANSAAHDSVAHDSAARNQ